MTVHDFGDRLRFSHSQADQPYWLEVYKQAFPDMVTCVDLRHDGWHQKAGRDRAIVLSSGKTIYVDEKVRAKAYEDILLEAWSTYPLDGEPPYPPRSGAVPGWATKAQDCDYLAYAFEPIQTCYMFPFLGVRAAWRKHCLTWRDKADIKEDGYRWVEALNSRYKTISLTVPISALNLYIQDALTISWSRSDSLF